MVIKKKSVAKKKLTLKKRAKPKEVHHLTVPEKATIKWAVDRDNSVCMLFDILAGLMVIYGLWFHNLYYIATAVVATMFGHSYARSRKK